VEVVVDINSAETVIPGLVHDATATYSVELAPVTDFDANVLTGKYTLRGEIKGGAMGRVFLARKDNVGNDWVIKYIPKSLGQLTNESEILKDLNHPSLPKIIDILKDEKGLYLVQSYIPGASMQSVLQAVKAELSTGPLVIPEYKLLDWAEELAEVLSHLHTRPQPIFHFDLKPSNIMVSHGGKIMLIDFGISRRQSDNIDAEALTYGYAAPEQIKTPPKRTAHKEIIEACFGTLPQARVNWPLDSRTDIYSLGVVLFEAAVGEIPTINNRDALKECLPAGFSKIIYKCLEIDPGNRYQSAAGLTEDLTHYRRYGMSKRNNTIVRRAAAKAASLLMVPVAAVALSAGMLVRAVEAAATMYVNPEIIMVSVQQSTEVQITRVLPSADNAFVGLFVGEEGEQRVDPNQLRWQAAANHIAQVDGNRVVGLNLGETIIHGQYRMQDIAMLVNVVEPMYGMVDISMRYRPGHYMHLFAGAGQRERVDGNLANVDFFFPESMAVTAGGAVYIADSGWLRRIQDGVVETVQVMPPFLRPSVVRAYHDDVYFLTHEWQDGGRNFAGIVRHTDTESQILYHVNTENMTIRDFAVSGERIYFIEYNDGLDIVLLRFIDRNDPSVVGTLATLEQGVSALSFAGGRTYLADEEQGTLLFYENGQLTHLAGVPGERAFIDGSAPLFYRPTRIRYYSGALYVWDFNVLRKVLLVNGAASEVISLAGMVSTTAPMEFIPQEPAESIVLPYSSNTDFIIVDGWLLISDPRRGLIWRFE